MVLEKTLDSHSDCKAVQPVNPKGNQSWIFFGRIDVEAETPILWPPDVKNWLIGKYSDAGKYWRQVEKGTTEDEMVGWHHWLDGHELRKLWESVMDKEAWRAAVHGVTKSRTRLRDWTELKVVLKGKFIRISIFIIKKKRSQIDNINLYPKEVEKEQQTKAQFNMEKKKQSLGQK